MTKRLGSFVRNSSRNSVIENLKYIKTNYLRNYKLLAKNNKLNKNAIKAIKKHYDARKPNFFIKDSEVGTYIAASSVSHLIDSWGYLSNSINAYMNGNHGVSIHLSYYSELRSVMSILATDGIGVFDQRHLSLSSNNTFSDFFKTGRGKGKPIGTHAFTWKALEKWSICSIKPSSEILNIFTVNGKNFNELIQGFHPSATPIVSSTLAKKWLKDWAFDIQKLTDDRELRNFVSYRPQSFSGFDQIIDFKDTLKNIYSFTELLSPSGNDPFHYIDRLLLRNLFKELYSTLNLNSTSNFEDLVTDSFTNVGITPDRNLMDLMLGRHHFVNDHLVFKQAKMRNNSPLPSLSRAILLLRVSTGLVSKILKDSNISKSDLKFIWDYYGSTNGFWNAPLSINDFYDLWIEMEMNYTDLTQGLDDLDNNHYSIRQIFDQNLDKISQIDRALLWGI